MSVIYIKPYKHTPVIINDPHWSDVKLLIRGNTDISDETGKTVTVIGNAYSTPTEFKYGGGSVFIDGMTPNSGLSVPNSSDWSIGSGNVTVEWWVNILGLPGPGTNAYFFNSSGINAYYNPNTNTLRSTIPSIGDFAGGNGVVFNQWRHMAVVKNGNNITFYNHGSGLLLTSSATPLAPSTQPFYVGTYNGNYGPTAYFDDFEFTRFAKYTGNFTPPEFEAPNF